MPEWAGDFDMDFLNNMLGPLLSRKIQGTTQSKREKGITENCIDYVKNITLHIHAMKRIGISVSQ